MPRTSTVRQKLLALVALSIAVTIATVPVLGWLLHDQLIEESTARVRSARHAYESELEERLTSLELAATMLSEDSDVQRALRDGDAETARKETTAFTTLYPDVDIVFVKKDGTILVAVGCDEDPHVLAERKTVTEALAGHNGQHLSGRGCDKVRMPTYLIARPAGEGGAILVGLEFSDAALKSTGSKLRLDLALTDPEGVVVHKTDSFPAGGEKVSMNDPKLIYVSDHAYVVEPFAPVRLKNKKGQYTLVASRDVTKMRSRILQHLGVAVAAVMVAAILSIIVGYRLAGTMSTALRRVSDSLKKLENQEYVKVVGVTTGDELEDLATGFNSMVDGLQERDKLRSTFGKYMTEAVMDHLMAGKVQLGGEALTATILFSDIRSFTSISEKMEAQELVSLLNEYFTEMVAVVIREDGVVDKYIGDAIMAVFGAPVPKPGDAIRAVRAAVGMREALVHLNVRLAERGIPPIMTGIGIHTGVVIAGNIGSEQRMEYTVIGDAVNLASRLESSTKALGTPVLISEDTYAFVKDHVEVRAVKEITVKGREKAVMTYEVLALKEPTKEGALEKDLQGG